MKKLLSLFFLFALVLPVGKVFAESNPELVAGLNHAFILETQSVEQAQEHSETLNILVPYHQFLREKPETAKELSVLIADLGGALEEKRYPIDIKQSPAKACNSDAALQIELVRHYDQMLRRFGHPRAAALIKKARDQAMLYFMLFTNRAQELSL